MCPKNTRVIEPCARVCECVGLFWVACVRVCLRVSASQKSFVKNVTIRAVCACACVCVCECFEPCVCVRAALLRDVGYNPRVRGRSRRAVRVHACMRGSIRDGYHKRC